MSVGQCSGEFLILFLGAGLADLGSSGLLSSGLAKSAAAAQGPGYLWETALFHGLERDLGFGTESNGDGDVEVERWIRLRSSEIVQFSR